MLTLSEIVLALFLLSDLALAGSGRLNHAIRLVAAQGWTVGLLPVILWNWQGADCPDARLWIVAVINMLVKGIALPMLLSYAVRKANTRRELEPIVSFRLSHLARDGVSREVPCSALKGETVPDSLPATPQKSPDTPGSPEGNTEGPGPASSEPLLPS